MMRPEILAPAGDPEKLRFAVDYGADAVYLAGKAYGMRSASDNFSREEIKEAVQWCHARGRSGLCNGEHAAERAGAEDASGLSGIFR